MTAKRYCGRITIAVTYQDREEQYRCFIACKADSCVIHVRPPAHLTHAVDSPEVFDETAHAALSFASADGETWIDGNADYTDSGWHIRRKKA